MARHAHGTQKALLYIAVMLPLWSSYLVRLYAWKLLLGEGRRDLVAGRPAAPHRAARRAARHPGDRRAEPELLGDRHIHRLRLHVAARSWCCRSWPRWSAFPASYIEASGDLGADPRTTFRKVILPLAMPGVAAGSIFTFSLTLGDYIIPQVIGDSTLYIGQVVYRQQGVAGNIPFAAAFSLVPIGVIGLYLWFAKRKGAFDAL
jgi:putative spermidine/putrescine transport system permease protein